MEMDMQSPVIATRSHQGFFSAVISFFVKLIVMVFLTADMTAVIVYLLYTKDFPWLSTIPIILAGFAGLSAGIFCRFFFFKMPRMIRWFLACTAVIATLAIGGLAGQQWLKIDLTGIRTAGVNNDFLILSGIGWGNAFLASFAWSKRKRQVTQSVPEPVMEVVPTPPTLVNHEPLTDYQPVLPVMPATPRPTIKTKSTSKTSSRIRWRKIRKQVMKSWSSFFKPGRRTHTNPIQLLFQPHPVRHRASERQASNRLQIRVPDFRLTAPAVVPPVRLPKRRSGRRHSKEVRFVGKEEMKCPYCLQPVDPRDPRGVVICPICHAAHHKECWDITGFCQVPHNHAVL